MRAAALTLSVLSAIGGFAAALLLFVLGFVLTLGDNDKYGVSVARLSVPREGLAQLDEDRRMGRIAEADYQARRQRILDRL